MSRNRSWADYCGYGRGTGFLTRLIAHGVDGKERMIGIDRNKGLLDVARKPAYAEGLADSLLSLRSLVAERVLKIVN